MVNVRTRHKTSCLAFTPHKTDGITGLSNEFLRSVKRGLVTYIALAQNIDGAIYPLRMSIMVRQVRRAVNHITCPLE